MEPEYEQLLQWEEPGPAGLGEAPEPDKPWGDGIVMYGPSQLLRGKQVPSLMADSYDFKSQEELLRVQKYCRKHGGWQLEQVSRRSKRLVACHYLPYYSGRRLYSRLYRLVFSCFLGQRSWQLPLCQY